MKEEREEMIKDEIGVEKEEKEKKISFLPLNVQRLNVRKHFSEMMIIRLKRQVKKSERGEREKRKREREESLKLLLVFNITVIDSDLSFCCYLHSNSQEIA